MRKGQPYAVSTLTRYTVLLTGFLLAVFALGLDVNRFTILAGAFGVGIGFGLQTIVNNFVSGIILLTEQPVQVGDTVELPGVFGVVQRIGIRSSVVRTWQGAEVIVPNADLMSEQVTNWTLSDQRRRLEIPIGVAYGTDPALVIDVLSRAAARNEYVVDDPAPVTLFMAFGDSALEFEVRCWTEMADMYLSVKSSVMVELVAALREVGVEIPFPQRDLHLRTIDASVADGLAGRTEGGGHDAAADEGGERPGAPPPGAPAEHPTPTPVAPATRALPPPAPSSSSSVAFEDDPD
jgi:small-conductance mechanosensitive channel